MSRKWTFLTLILLFGSGSTLQAQPQDSADIVYIDGLPCNRACQSYMEWSYRVLSARRHEARETYVTVPREAEADWVEPAVRPRAVRQAAPVSRTAPPAGKVASNGRTTGSKPSAGRKIATSNAAPQTPRKEPPAVAAAPPQQAASETAAAATPKPAAKSEVATAVTQPPPATLEIATRPAPPATTAKAGEAGRVASASPDDLDNLVALVLAGPEINSLSDLNNRNIAIAEKQSASSGRVSAALMAAGAAEVRFSEVKTSAIDQLIDGAVPAAVVLAPRDVANLFPEVAGFRTFRVPLKARL